MMCGLYHYSKKKLGCKVERKWVLRKSVTTDRCLESLKRVLGWGNFFYFSRCFTGI